MPFLFFFNILRGSGSCSAAARVIVLAPAVHLCKGRRVFVYKVPGFPVADEEEEARVYLAARRVWSAEAISKGSYRKVKTGSADAPQEHSAVKNPPRLKSVTAFRDLVGAQAFSFTPPLTHENEGDTDGTLLTFQLLLKAAGLGAFGCQHSSFESSCRDPYHSIESSSFLTFSGGPGVVAGQTPD